MTELEEGSFWAGFSPYCLKSALPAENSPTLPDTNLRLRWIRIYWWFLLLLVYSALLLESNVNRELSSAVRYEVIEQLFPDWNKAAERTRDAEISPSLKELLMADDVAKIMSFYNDLCASQSSISASMKANWNCKLFDIKVQEPGGDNWDPTTNRALPDVDKDNPVMNGTRGILEAKARFNKTNKELAKAHNYEIKQICSENFFQTHFIIGDDPRKIPLGDVNAFSQRVREVHPGLDPVFDQFWLHNQGFGGMKQMLNEIKEEVREVKESQKPLDHAGRLSTRLQRRSPWLLDVDTEIGSEEVPAKPEAKAEATNATAAQGLASPANWSESGGNMAKDQIFPSGANRVFRSWRRSWSVEGPLGFPCWNRRLGSGPQRRGRQGDGERSVSECDGRYLATILGRDEPRWRLEALGRGVSGFRREAFEGLSVAHPRLSQLGMPQPSLQSLESMQTPRDFCSLPGCFCAWQEELCWDLYDAAAHQRRALL